MTTGLSTFIRIELLLRYVIHGDPIASNRVQGAERSGSSLGEGAQGSPLASANAVKSAAAVSPSAASARVDRPRHGSRRTNCSVEYTRSNLG